MQAKRKMKKKKSQNFTLIGPAAKCSFNPGSHNSSSRFRELHNQAQALMQAKRKMKKKNQTFHTHWASYQVQIQPRVTHFKLSLPRAS
jgi:hypothetical protein